MSTKSVLSTFLSSQKSLYLQDIQNGKGKEWTVVMGNEAGGESILLVCTVCWNCAHGLPDLDSIASSIGYAFFAAATSDQPATSADKPTPLKFVPLVQTARGDLTLRPENIEAFKKSSLSADNTDLLCIDDITSITPFPSDKFVLVDHNRLGETFHAPDSSEQVVIT
jgi:exopolyphosphatase